MARKSSGRAIAPLPSVGKMDALIATEAVSAGAPDTVSAAVAAVVVAATAASDADADADAVIGSRD